jgi:TIR domain
MAHDVFISYSTEDKPAADAVCAILEKNGVRCWIAPRDIMPGADWGESIVKGIRSSRVLLLVFSTNANNSRQIKREVEIAADGGVTIVPLRIENILPTESFKYFLGNIHWLDALTPPLEKHLQEVAAKVKAILSTESVSPPEASQPSSLAHAPTVQQPARRNVLPVIGGIIAVLIVTSVLLFVWQRRTTAPPAAVQSASISGTVASSSVSPVSVVPTPPPVVPPAAVQSAPISGTVVSSSVSPVSAESIKSASTPEPVPKTSTSTADKDAMIFRILRAIETHDSGAFLAYTVDKQTDYFGHKNASNAFIQHDMERDTRSYKWTRFVPDLSTFETSLGHESIEFHSDALDVQGTEHKARCRLDIYYTPTSPPRLQTVSLKVLG